MSLSEIANTVCMFKSLFNDKRNPKSTQELSYHIVSEFFTGKIVKQPKRILVKYPAQRVCLNHWSINKITRNQPSKLAKKGVLFFTGQIMQKNRMNISETATTMSLLQ